MLECARHLQASYVDQPLLAPLLARVSLKLFGLSLTGLRVWPALAAWATVVAGGLSAREFAVAGARSCWPRSGRPRCRPCSGALMWPTRRFMSWQRGRAWLWWWPGSGGPAIAAGGLVTGLGVADDHSAAFFAIALVTGALLSGGRRMIFNRWFAAGAAIAVAFEVPDLWWQAQHQWATIAMTHALNHENGGLANVATFVIGQVGLVTLAMAWVWVAGAAFPVAVRAAAVAGNGVGVRAAVRALRAHRWREDLLPRRRVRVPARRRCRGHRRVAASAARPLRNLMLATALTTAAALPVVLPVLPPAGTGWTYKISPTLDQASAGLSWSAPSTRYGRHCHPGSVPAP